MADDLFAYSMQPLMPIDNRSQMVSSPQTRASSAGSFAGCLQKEISSVRFSQHAVSRLQDRNLQLNDSDLSRLGSAVDKMAQKGAKESLVLMKDIALVVSVANRTVITAMDGNSAKENVFTNIDSAVIL